MTSPQVALNLQDGYVEIAVGFQIPSKPMLTIRVGMEAALPGASIATLQIERTSCAFVPRAEVVLETIPSIASRSVLTGLQLTTFASSLQ